MLPLALIAYKTSIHTSTGATPFSLVNESETILPIEVEISYVRILVESSLDEAERYKQLNLIDEK